MTCLIFSYNNIVNKRYDIFIMLFIRMALPPNTQNHMKLYVHGITNVYVMNSLIVRPRLIFAMNMPTKGDQLIHQPQ